MAGTDRPVSRRSAVALVVQRIGRDVADRQRLAALLGRDGF
jgi:hypothetical protein